MKPFLLRLSVFAAIQLLIAGFVLLRGNPRNDNHYYLGMLDKLQHMEQTQEPRLLLVGGSNLAFGMNCELLKETGHEPINLGLNAGLGLEFYLKIVEDRVRAGDIVLLSPEYELFTDFHSPSITKDFIRVCPELAHYFDVPADPALSWKYQLDHQALPTIHAWVRTAFKKRRRDDGAVYARKSFNAYGDIVAHWDLPTQGEIVAIPITFDPERVRQTIRRLNAFAEHCRNQGAEVYFSYPPLPQDRFASLQEPLAQIRQLLDQELRVAQIDQPADHVYEKTQFFDSHYHLGGQAAAARTLRLLNSLKTCRVANAAEPTRTATSTQSRRN